MNVYDIGDKVRILHTDYTGEGLEVGTVHKVSAYFAGTGGVELYAPNLDVGLYFSHSEVEPYTPANTIKLNQQYTSKNGHKWECIAVRCDVAWLVAGNGKGAAYTFKLDGTNICQGGGAFDIKWEPVVEWVEDTLGYDTNDRHIYSTLGDVKINVSFPLIDGEPDFTQARITRA